MGCRNYKDNKKNTKEKMRPARLKSQEKNLSVMEILFSHLASELLDFT
jgi:hypothetical protein